MASTLVSRLDLRSPRASLRARILLSLALCSLLGLPTVVLVAVSAGHLAADLTELDRAAVSERVALGLAEGVLARASERPGRHALEAVRAQAGEGSPPFVALEKAFRQADAGEGPEAALAAVRVARVQLEEAAAARREVVGHVLRMQRNVIAVVLLTLLVVAFALYWLPRQIVRPLARVENAIRRAGDGDLTVTADTDIPPEISDIARAVNRLVEVSRREDLLKVQRIRALRRTLELIGQQIGEPTVVLDGARAIEYANSRFIELAGSGPESISGLPLTQVLKDASIRRLLDRLYRGETVVEPVRFTDARGQEHLRRLGTGAGRDARGEIIRLVLVFSPAEEGQPMLPAAEAAGGARS